MSAARKKSNRAKPVEKDGGVTCVICTDELKDIVEPGYKGDLLPLQPVKYPCDHLFHKKCLDAWRAGKKEANRLCPICMQDPLVLKEKLRVERERRDVLKETRSRLAASEKSWTMDSGALRRVAKQVAISGNTLRSEYRKITPIGK